MLVVTDGPACWAGGVWSASDLMSSASDWEGKCSREGSDVTIIATGSWYQMRLAKRLKACAGEKESILI